MRDSSWHSQIQARYEGYSVDQLKHIRGDATAAARLVVSGSPRQNDYLDMALYASKELKRREGV